VSCGRRAGNQKNGTAVSSAPHSFYRGELHFRARTDLSDRTQNPRIWDQGENTIAAGKCCNISLFLLRVLLTA